MVSGYDQIKLESHISNERYYNIKIDRVCVECSVCCVGLVGELRWTMAHEPADDNSRYSRLPAVFISIVGVRQFADFHCI